MRLASRSALTCRLGAYEDRGFGRSRIAELHTWSFEPRQADPRPLGNRPPLFSATAA